MSDPWCTVNAKMF